MDRKDEAKKEFTHTHGTPPRVAPRLEGKVRNVGIKPKRKQSKKKEQKKKQQENRKKSQRSGKVSQ